MPLLDHFNPPLSHIHRWRSFHAAWAASIARLLNHGVLPEGYFAAPNVDQSGPVEIDVATLRKAEAPVGESMWCAPAPSLAVAIELPPTDDIEVQILTDDGDPRLMAAIELVSPSNKDRPKAREAFAAKCVRCLQQGSSVVVVDTVTTRRADLNAEILSRLASESTLDGGGLSVTSYRIFATDEDVQNLEAWQSPLALGDPLPKMPLWIGAEFSVPLDLDASYQATCADLRIRQAS